MSSYLQHLPAILQQEELLGRFLLAFEAVLSGLDPSQVSAPKPTPAEVEGHAGGLALPIGLDKTKLIGLEQLLDQIERFFDPQTAPEDFLPWLAQWVATSLRDDWDAARRRAFIAGIVPLYRIRGTRLGIQKVLELSGDAALIVEREDRPFPHYFEVILTITSTDPVVIARKQRRVRAIVDREKPAHTYYSIRTVSPAMQINNDPEQNPSFGPGIFVGKTTVLGTGTT